MHIYNYSFELTGFLVLNSCRFSQLASCWAGEVARSSQSQIAKDVRGSQKETRAQRSGLVKEQWKKREQNAMAKLLMDANWDKDHAYIFYLMCVLCVTTAIWKI